MNDLSRIRELDRRAVDATRMPVLAAMREPSRPTPCAGWTVHELVTHMTGQHIGFAAAARDRGTDLALWRSSEDDYDGACDDVLAAFATLTPDAMLDLPELGDARFPAATAVLIHFVDNVVHAWDVAVSTGVTPDLDDEVVTRAAEVAAQIPDGAAREEPGAAFGPALPPVDGDDGMRRMLRLLGRDPEWSAVSR